MTTIPTSIHLIHPHNRARTVMLILVLLAGALAIRLPYYPGNAYRSVDEPSYTSGGLMLAEGLAPTYKAAPGAPIVWTSWAFAMVDAARHLQYPDNADKGVTPFARPSAALNAALFDAYHDGTRLRKVHLIGSITFGLLAVWGATRYGLLRGGFLGGALLGCVVAFSPLFVSFSLMTLPHIYAWALAIWAMYLAAAGGDCRRRWAFILLGLAIATRFEMVLMSPLLLWETWGTMPKPRSWNAIKGLLLSAVAALAAAPWLLTSLLTNVRSIVAARVMANNSWQGASVESILTGIVDSLCLQAGLLPSIIFLLIAMYAGLLFKPTRGRFFWALLISAAIIALGIRGVGQSLFQEGPLVLTILLLSAYGLPAMGESWCKICGIIVAVAIGIGVSMTVLRAEWRAPAGTNAPVAEWIEANVRPGTQVYWDARTPRQIVPTRSASDAMWTEAATAAWRSKLAWANDPITGEPPRALSIDMMPKEYSIYRAYFILGGRTRLAIPRFDVYPRYGLTVRGETSFPERLATTSGVYVLTAPKIEDEINSALGKPVMTWEQKGSMPTYVWARGTVLLQPAAP
ncbi:MAG: hypothetical protein H7144_06780 [Burkholderiales bacterium]|nr:hypothetical protein [Phycisphaerae bacterium]